MLEWRAILEAHGFLDTLLYEVEPSPHPSPNPNPNPSPNPGPSPNPNPNPSPNPGPSPSPSPNPNLLCEVEAGDCTEDEMLCFIRLADDDAALPDATATTLPPLPMRVATEARRVPTSTPLVRAGLTPLRKALYNAPAALLEALKAAAHC